LTVTGLAALPASASAGDFVAPPPPAVDSVAAFGSNATFDLSVKAANSGRANPTAATGGFVFDALAADIEVSGDATCLAVKGGVATFGGRITGSEGTLKKDGLQVGQFVEMTFAAPNATSPLILRGSQPATCDSPHDLTDVLEPGAVLIVDR